MTLKKEQYPGIDFLNTIPQYLTRFSNEGNNQFGKYMTGYLNSLKVSITETGVKIYDSSICKYFLGDNFKTLSKGDTKRAIEQISDCLHLPFSLADVTRLDFAKNMIMQFDEKVYFSCLGEAQYYNRLEQNNGLYYNNRLRQLLFYGKVHEQKEKRKPIPELYKDRNVLRFEIRFKKRLREQFNQPEIKAGLLYNEEFYSFLSNRWKNEYLAIQKINSKLRNMKPTGSKKEFIEYLAQYTILELGQGKVLNLIKEWQKTDQINKKQAYDLRTSIKELSSYLIDEKGNELINELDKKVKEAVRYW